MEISFVNEKIEELKSQQEAKKSVSARYSTIRFLLIVAVLYCFYMGYQQYTLFYVLAVFGLLLFLWFVRLHAIVKQDLSDLETLQEVYQDILARKGSEWKHFKEQGSSYLNETTMQEYDLDIFGKTSLYQYLSVAHTYFGKDALASLLSCKRQDVKELKQRQEAIRELLEKQEFTLHMTQLSKLYGKHGKKKKRKTMDEFFAYMEDRQITYPAVFRVVTKILPVVTIGCCLATIMFQISYGFALVSAMLSMCIALLFFMKNSASLGLINAIADMMKDYERMFAALQEEEFTSTYLKELKSQVKNANQGIRELNTILQFVRLRSNGIMVFVANAFFLLDFQCVYALEKWKGTYGLHVKEWLETIGSVEGMLSLAQIGLVKDQLCFPRVIESNTPSFEMKQLHHPLLMEANAVANSFEATHGSYVITGSNMSGKTTFLRTIGVNMVLFHAGAPVCAKEFSASSMNIFTSMRVHDDVSEGISTFYAEILRIKQMMQESDKKEPMLVLIDEIFKGTNSADRILCAKQAIVRLHLPWVITMVSTHDFELCDLAKDDQIKAKNNHFSEYYEEDTICFDYLLKNGRCTTTNAKQLMKLAGF